MRHERDFHGRRLGRQIVLLPCLETERPNTDARKPTPRGHFPHVSAKPPIGRVGGGRDRDRTCDPLHVKEVLSRCRARKPENLSYLEDY
jgi:hypothetical protein